MTEELEKGKTTYIYKESNAELLAVPFKVLSESNIFLTVFKIQVSQDLAIRGKRGSRGGLQKKPENVFIDTKEEGRRCSTDIHKI